MWLPIRWNLPLTSSAKAPYFHMGKLTTTWHSGKLPMMRPETERRTKLTESTAKMRAILKVPFPFSRICQVMGWDVGKLGRVGLLNGAPDGSPLASEATRGAVSLELALAHRGC